MLKGFTYITTNKNSTVLYIGATKDLKKELKVIKMEQELFLQKKYNATILIYFEEFDNHIDPFAREKQLKNWHKDWKWNLAKVLNPELKDLYLDL